MDIETSPQEFAQGLCDLMKEYSTKLNEIMRQVRVAREAADKRGGTFMRSSEFTLYNSLVSSLHGPLLDLSREASQLSEQGAVRDLTRVELKIRRAELEALVNSVFSLIHSPS